MIEGYRPPSTQEVLSAKTCVFLGKTYKNFLEGKSTKQYTIQLLTDIWDVVSGCVDRETIDIFDEIWKEVNNASNRI